MAEEKFDRAELTEREQSPEGGSPAVVAETEAPDRTSSWLWILAGVLLIVAGALRLFRGDLNFELNGALVAIILVGAGFLCLFVAAGFIRRPRGRGREGSAPPA